MKDLRTKEEKIKDEIAGSFREANAELIHNANQPGGDYYALREAWSFWLDGYEKSRQAPLSIIEDLEWNYCSDGDI